MRPREIVGLVMLVLAFGLMPFANGASLYFGLFAFAVGVGGVALFFSARPWRSRSVRADEIGELRIPWTGSKHGGEHGPNALLHVGGDVDGAVGGIDGGGDGGGH